MEQRIGDNCVHYVVTVARSASVSDAANLMRKHHVGAVVIVEGTGAKERPVGMLTDRDIVVEAVAAGLNPGTLTVGEIVQRPLCTISADATPAEAVREMSINGVRRLPVVKADGALVGIATLDDLLLQLIAPLAAIGDLAGRERRLESRTRSV